MTKPNSSFIANCSIFKIRRWCYNLTPAESIFKTPMLDHQDKHMMKAQVHVSKSSTNSDVQPPPRRKQYCQIYQVVKHMLRGRLLANFQDHEHEGGDTRSQGGIKDNDVKIKIQDHSMKMISQMNSQEQGSKIQESDGNDKIWGCYKLASRAKVYREPAVMSSASSTITYTSVYTDFEPGRVFWEADEELSDGGSLRVIVYRYDGFPMQSVAPLSPDYIPGPEEPQTSPEEHVLSAEEQPLPLVVSPTAESPRYVAESNPEEDPEEYEEDETEDGLVDYPMDGGDDGDDDDDSSGDNADDEDEDEEEEHLAPVDSAIIIPTVELVSPHEGTEPASTSLRSEAEVERLLAMPTPPPSPLTSLSPPSTGERLARMASTQALIDAVSAALPSPPLPPPIYIPPPVDRKDDIPETEMPPRKRSCLFALGSKYEIGESSTARPTGGRWIDYGFVSTLDAEARRRGIGEVGYGIRDTWVDTAEAVPEIAPMTLGERVDLLMEDRIAHQETILIVEEKAYAVREAWAHSIGLSQAVHSELQTHREQMQQAEMAELRETNRKRQAQMAEILRVMGDMRREMVDMQAELLALREQPRRARQPGSDSRVPDHQDAPKDADSHI
nr:hypothetical protein [Tanacetum cinerariifolium]